MTMQHRLVKLLQFALNTTDRFGALFEDSKDNWFKFTEIPLLQNFEQFFGDKDEVSPNPQVVDC